MRERKNWQDVYYDGALGCGDLFCEDSQKIIRHKEDGRRKWRQRKDRGFLEDASDDWYLDLMFNAQKNYYKEPFNPKMDSIVLIDEHQTLCLHCEKPFDPFYDVDFYCEDCEEETEGFRNSKYEHKDIDDWDVDDHLAAWFDHAMEK